MSKEQYKNSVLDRPGHPDGMTVPEGFFESFTRDMAAKLPPNDLEQQPIKALQPPTRWQRMRPFVYMAAMFAGIWCMMKMFSMMQNNSADLSFGTNPEFTAVLTTDDYVSDYVIDGYGEDQLLDDLYDDGYSVADLSI